MPKPYLNIFSSWAKRLPEKNTLVECQRSDATHRHFLHMSRFFCGEYHLINATNPNATDGIREAWWLECPEGFHEWNFGDLSCHFVPISIYFRPSFHVMSYIFLIGRSWRITAARVSNSTLLRLVPNCRNLSSLVGQSALEIKKLDRRIWVKFIQDVGAVDINLLGHRL